MKQKSGVLFFLLCFSVVISGCSNLNYGRPITSFANVDSQKGYLYGRFMLERDVANLRRLSLQIENVETGKITGIRLRDDLHVYAVSVKPGTYRIKGLAYAPLGATLAIEVTKTVLPAEPVYLHQSFKVEPGKFYYLGEFYGVSHIDNLGVYVGQAVGHAIGAGLGGTYKNVRPDDEGVMSIVALQLTSGLLGVRQDFPLTTQAIKHSMTGVAGFTFQSAWGESFKME